MSVPKKPESTITWEVHPQSVSSQSVSGACPVLYCLLYWLPALCITAINYAYKDTLPAQHVNGYSNQGSKIEYLISLFVF